MRYSIASAVGLLLASASAIQITAPTKNEQVDLNDYSYKVTWDTVSSDPTSAHLFLVNMAGGHTPYSKDLGAIDLTKGSFTVSKMTISPDTDFQFNIQSVTENNMGILAQSQQFDIIKSNSTSSSTTTTTAASSASSGTGGSNPGASTVGASGFTTATSATSTATGGANSTKTSTSASNTATSGSNAVKVASGSFLALLFGAAAIVA